MRFGMKKLFLLLWSVAAVSAAVGQPSWRLYFEPGLGASVFRDMGTSPLSYHGPMGTISMGYQHEGKVLVEADVEASAGLMHSAISKGLNYPQVGGFAMVEAGVAKNLSDRLSMRHLLQVGVGAMGYADLRYNASLGNTALMLTGLAAIRAWAEMSEIVGWKSANKRYGIDFDHSLMARLELLPVGMFVRPDFGYNDNFTAYNDDQYLLPRNLECRAKAFPGVAATVGLVRRNGASGDVTRLSYRWMYITTGRNVEYPFAAASHSLRLQVTLMNRIKKNNAL